MILAVPLSAIGVVNAGLAGLIVTWAGIAGVNMVHAARDGGLFQGLRHRSKSSSESDWED